jgi:hypothetical protein
MIKPGLIAALLAACIALIGAVWLIKGDRPRAAVQLKIGSRLVEDVEPESISSIRIKKGAIEIVLEQSGGKWTMPSHKNRPVAEERVKELISTLLQAVVTDTREASDEDFELDAPRRTEITLNTLNGSRRIYAGTSLDAQDVNAPARSFVKTQETGTVYEINAALDAAAGVVTENDARMLDPRRFYNLKIIQLDTREVIDIAIKKGHALTRVQRVIPGKGPVPVGYMTQKGDDKPVWWITEPQGGPAEPSAVSQILSLLMDFDAKSYADKITLEQAGLDQPAAKVRVHLRNGHEHTFVFGKIQGDQVFMKMQNNENIFAVYRYRYDNMALGFDDLKLKNAPETNDPAPDKTPRDPARANTPSTPKRAPVAPPPPLPTGEKNDPKPVDTVIIQDAKARDKK